MEAKIQNIILEQLQIRLNGFSRDQCTLRFKNIGKINNSRIRIPKFMCSEKSTIVIL